jgi:urease beta subunit
VIPGEVETLDGDIEINPNRTLLTVVVCNAGDRPIQVGSHYHFYETNAALEFDREQDYGLSVECCSRHRRAI